jgi:c-di-GMP-binding flagellar brake protein YcgR
MPNGLQDGQKENRLHPRVSVQFRSHFSSKNRMVAGDGELKDLSPGGCRVASSVAAQVGAELELCIFPADEGNPFIIDTATVRWARDREFGLAFTQMRPAVEQQLLQLCRKRAPLS